MILKNLKARLKKFKNEWVEDFPSLLWAYPMGETLYSVYGTESVIPVKIGMPSFRVLISIRRKTKQR